MPMTDVAGLAGSVSLQALGKGAAGNEQAHLVGVAGEIVVDQHPGMAARPFAVARPALFKAEFVEDTLQPLHVALRQGKALCRSQRGHLFLPQHRVPRRALWQNATELNPLGMRGLPVSELVGQAAGTTRSTLVRRPPSSMR